MNTKILFAGLITATALLSSCRLTPDLDNEIRLVDSTMVQLSELREELSHIDTTTLLDLYMRTSAEADTLTARIKGDTIYKQAAIRIADAYSKLFESARCLNENLELQELIDSAQKNVENLKSDLQKSVHEKKRAAEYALHESESAQKLRASGQLIKARSVQLIHDLDSIAKAIPALNDSLR